MFTKICTFYLVFCQFVAPSFSQEKETAFTNFQQIQRPFKDTLSLLQSTEKGSDYVYCVACSNSQTLFYMRRILGSQMVISKFLGIAYALNSKKGISSSPGFPSWWQQLTIVLQASVSKPISDWFMELLAKSELADPWKQDYLLSVLLTSAIHHRGPNTRDPYWAYKNYIERTADMLGSTTTPIQLDSMSTADEILRLRTAYDAHIDGIIGESVFFWPQNAWYQSWGFDSDRCSKLFPSQALAGFSDENRALILEFFQNESVKYVIDSLNRCVRYPGDFYLTFMHRNSGFIGSILERLYYDRPLNALRGELRRMIMFCSNVVESEKFKEMVAAASLRGKGSHLDRDELIAREYLIHEVGYPLVTGEPISSKIKYIVNGEICWIGQCAREFYP